jgi:hypothetical protein
VFEIKDLAEMPGPFLLAVRKKYGNPCCGGGRWWCANAVALRQQNSRTDAGAVNARLVQADAFGGEIIGRSRSFGA